MVIHTIPNLGMANTLINDKTFKEELLCRSYMYIHPMRGADAFPLLLAMHQSYPFTRSVLQASTITWSLLFHKCISAAAFPVFTLLKEILPNTTHPDEQSVSPQIETTHLHYLKNLENESQNEAYKKNTITMNA